MKRNRLLLIIIGILVLTNVYLLWYVNNEPKKEEPKPTRTERMKSYAQKEMGFTEEQANEYVKLRLMRDSILQPLNAELRAAKMAIIDLKNTDNPSDSAVNAVMANIGEKQQAVEMAFLAHFQRLNALCTPEQRPRFDSLLQRAIRRNTGGERTDSTAQR